MSTQADRKRRSRTARGRLGTVIEFRAAFVFEVVQSRHLPGSWIPLITAPLYTAMFLSITSHAGRDDLAAYGVLAPALIVLWRNALFEAGEIIEREKWSGTLEALVATPAKLNAVVLGRVLAIVTYGALGFFASWVTAAVGFGIVIAIPHLGWFLMTVVATCAAMAGTATIMAAVFVLARTARTFQNTLSYPIYVLGGVMVPVSLLPAWVEPISRGVFLSWSSDLLRDSLAPAPIVGGGFRLGMVVALGIVGFALGRLLLARIETRVRSTGALSNV